MGVPCYNLTLKNYLAYKAKNLGFTQKTEKLLFLAFILKTITT